MSNIYNSYVPSREGRPLPPPPSNQRAEARSEYYKTANEPQSRMRARVISSENHLAGNYEIIDGKYYHDFGPDHGGHREITCRDIMDMTISALKHYTEHKVKADGRLLTDRDHTDVDNDGNTTEWLTFSEASYYPLRLVKTAQLLAKHKDKLGYTEEEYNKAQTFLRDKFELTANWMLDNLQRNKVNKVYQVFADGTGRIADMPAHKKDNLFAWRGTEVNADIDGDGTTEDVFLPIYYEWDPNNPDYTWKDGTDSAFDGEEDFVNAVYNANALYNEQVWQKTGNTRDYNTIAAEITETLGAKGVGYVETDGIIENFENNTVDDCLPWWTYTHLNASITKEWSQVNADPNNHALTFTVTPGSDSGFGVAGTGYNLTTDQTETERFEFSYQMNSNYQGAQLKVILKDRDGNQAFQVFDITSQWTSVSIDFQDPAFNVLNKRNMDAIVFETEFNNPDINTKTTITIDDIGIISDKAGPRNVFWGGDTYEAVNGVNSSYFRPDLYRKVFPKLAPSYPWRELAKQSYLEMSLSAGGAYSNPMYYGQIFGNGTLPPEYHSIDPITGNAVNCPWSSGLNGVHGYNSWRIGGFISDDVNNSPDVPDEERAFAAAYADGLADIHGQNGSIPVEIWVDGSPKDSQPNFGADANYYRLFLSQYGEEESITLEYGKKLLESYQGTPQVNSELRGYFGDKGESNYFEQHFPVTALLDLYNLLAGHDEGDPGTVDDEAPVISQANLPIEGITGETVSVEITGFSDNVGVAGARIKVNGTTYDMVLLNGTYKHTIYIPFNDMSDINYSVEVYDLAGNSSPLIEKTINVTDKTKPTIIHTPVESISNKENLEISAGIFDANGLLENSCTLYWIRDGETSYHEETLVFETGEYKTVISKVELTGNIKYYITATDTSGNIQKSQEYNVAVTITTEPVTDTEAPFISNISAPDNANTGDTVVVNVTATDNTGITSASIIFLDGDNIIKEKPLITSDNINFSCNIDIPINTTNTITYKIKMADAAGNSTISGEKTIKVTDSIKPVITHTPVTSATTANQVIINAEFADNIELASKLLHWSYEGENTEALIPFVHVSGNTYQAVIDQSFLTGNIEYRIGVSDKAGNTTSTDPVTITVADSTKPSISIITAPTSGKTGESVNVEFETADNFEVTKVSIVINNIETDLALSADNKYNGSIPIPKNNISPINYYIKTADAAGNITLSETKTITVTDSKNPAITNISAPLFANNGDSVQIEVTVSDNIGVANAYILFNDEEIPLAQAGAIYTGNIAIPENSTADVIYKIKLVDFAGNSTISGTHTIHVADTTEPLIKSVVTPPNAATGSKAAVKVTCSDNIAVLNAYIFINNNEKKAMTLEKDEYIYNIDIPENDINPINYFIVVSDTSGNTKTTQLYTLNISDTNFPAITSATTPLSGNTGETARVAASCADNIGIDIVSIFVNDIKYPMDWDSEKEEYFFNIDIPKDNLSPINYYISVSDTEENITTSQLYSLQVYDTIKPEPPESPLSTPANTGDTVKVEI
ncbi:MAG: hypothetical protein ABIH39_04920, partial [Candidatus Margulisiibacteriota bacterium]